MKPASPIHTVHHHGLMIEDYEFQVPLDYDKPTQEKISVFARALRNRHKPGTERPWLIFLQGGPGFPGPRPVSITGWMKKALEGYHVLILDSRGNGRSTPILPQTLARFKTPQDQAHYLSLFRADNIVRDAEAIRQQLLGADSQWSVLGQSFGGFCAVNYLSYFPGSLREVFITGGLPPIEDHPDAYYRLTYPEVARKTKNYFSRYPGDEALCTQILEHLHRQKVMLPGGGQLTPRRFQQVGFLLGADEGMENLHHLLEGAFCQGESSLELSYPFLRAFENLQPFETNPLFAILHEMCYTQGFASNWSAERIRSEFPQANWTPGSAPSFTGEMIYPWMFDEYPQLRPLKEAAQLLAIKTNWPRLYDKQQLNKNTVPAVAVIYAEDMYVPRALSEQTAANIKGLKVWLTNEYEHSGLRHDDRVFTRLLAMQHDLL